MDCKHLQNLLHPLFCAISDSGPLSSQSLSVEKAGDCKGFCREQHNEASPSHWPVLNWRLENGCCGKPYIRTYIYIFMIYLMIHMIYIYIYDIQSFEKEPLTSILTLSWSRSYLYDFLKAACSHMGLWFGAMSSYQLYSLYSMAHRVSSGESSGLQSERRLRSYAAPACRSWSVVKL